MYVRTFRPNRTIGLSATALYRFTVCRLDPSYHHMSYLRNSLMLFWFGLGASLFAALIVATMVYLIVVYGRAPGKSASE